MLKNFFPNKILSIKNKLISSLLILMIFVIFVGLIYALFISPPDYIQGDSVRIMYVHVPSSFIALGCFAIIGTLSILNIIFKIKYFPLIGKSLAPIGCIFTLISIVTGSLWGKPTWGTWWAWDARLTSMLILFFLYALYILTWKLIHNFEKAKIITSIISIIGLFNLPIIKYSVDWWNTLHQPASIKIAGTSTIHSSMLLPLILMLLVLLLYSALIFLMKYKTEIIRIKKKNLKRI